MFDELLEPEARGFLHDLCEARVPSLSHELSELTGEPFGQAHGDVSVSHSGMSLPRVNRLKLFDSSSAGIFHKVDDARVAMFTRNSFNLGVQVRWDRRCLPTRFLPPRHYKGLAKNLLTTNLIKVLQRY